MYAKAELANLATVYKWKHSQRLFLMPGSHAQGFSPLWTYSGHRPLAVKGIHRKLGRTEVCPQDSVGFRAVGNPEEGVALASFP